MPAASTTQRGLTQALGCMGDNNGIPKKLDWVARLICLAIGAALTLGAATIFSGWATSGLWFWLFSALALVFLVLAFFAPRRWRNTVLSWFPASGW
jgi:heme A synthase